MDELDKANQANRMVYPQSNSDNPKPPPHNPMEDLQKYETFQLNITVSQFSGFSNSYTQERMATLEDFARRFLDDHIGFVNDKNQRVYTIETKSPEWHKPLTGGV